MLDPRRHQRQSSIVSGFDLLLILSVCALLFTANEAMYPGPGSEPDTLIVGRTSTGKPMTPREGRNVTGSGERTKCGCVDVEPPTPPEPTSEPIL